MKKNLLIFLAVVGVFFCIFEGIGDLAEDKDKDNDDNDSIDIVNPDEIVVQDYDEKIHYTLAYCTEKDCPNGNIDDSFLCGRMKCNIGETCFLVLDFTMDDFLWWDGWDKFSASVEISPADAIDVRLEEAATSNIEADTERSVYTATYKVPEEISEARSYRIVFRMTLTQKEKDFAIGVAFHPTWESPSYHWTIIEL